MAWRMDPLLESPFEVLLVESQKNPFGAAGQNGTRTESLGNISDLALPSAGWSWHEVGKMCLKTAQAMVAQH